MVEFGGVAQVQEEVRETWVWRWLDHAGRDRAIRGTHGCAPVPVSRRPRCCRWHWASAPTPRSSRWSTRSCCVRWPCRSPDRLVQFDWRGNSLSNSWGGGSLLSFPLCRDLHEQTAVLRRRVLPPADDRELLHRRAARTGARRARVGRVLPDAGRASRARSPHRSVGRRAAGRASSGRAVAIALAESPRRCCRRGRADSPDRQLPDDRDRRRAGGLHRASIRWPCRRCGFRR